MRSEKRDGGLKRRLGRAYERFLGLPVPVVLASLWLAGTALASLCALALCLLWLLLRAAAGA